MYSQALIYSLSLLVGLIGFPDDGSVKTGKSAKSVQCWLDTLKRPEQTNFKETTSSRSTVIPDSTIRNQPSVSSTSRGKSLIAGSHCRACHQLATRAIGPSFTEIAQRYRDDKTATAKLVNKIISGGSGVWGEHMMSAHPQLSNDEATEMVNYILSVSK